jgi:hypothetical protein
MTVIRLSLKFKTSICASNEYQVQRIYFAAKMAIGRSMSDEASFAVAMKKYNQ